MGVLTDDITHSSDQLQQANSSNVGPCQNDVSPCSSTSSTTTIPERFFDFKADCVTNPAITGYCTNDIGDGSMPPPLLAIETPEQAHFLRTRGSKKEKKRTEYINSAFTELRRRIPNVPLDTKLSKIKTLRLATSYIAYLTDIVRNGDPGDVRDGREFCADLKTLKTKERRRDNNNQKKQTTTDSDTKASGGQRHDVYRRPRITGGNLAYRKKGRTGWPETVWAMELENISPSSFEQNKSPNDQEMNIQTMQQSDPPLYPTVYAHPQKYPNSFNNNEVGNNQFNITQSTKNVTSSYSNGLMGYSIIPHIRESTGCPTESLPPYEEFLPYFQYPTIPLPPPSTLRKPYTPFHPPQGSMHNCHGLTNMQNVSAMGVVPGPNPPQYSRGCPDKTEGQNYLAAGFEDSANFHSAMIAEITFIPGEESENFMWGSDGGEEMQSEEIKPVSAKFAELKTVSASSIRISTATINGSGIFTSPGPQEFPCFGATRIMATTNVV